MDEVWRVVGIGVRREIAGDRREHSQRCVLPRISFQTQEKLRILGFVLPTHQFADRNPPETEDQKRARLLLHIKLDERKKDAEEYLNMLTEDQIKTIVKKYLMKRLIASMTQPENLVQSVVN